MENPKEVSNSPEPSSRRKESHEYVKVAVVIIEQDGKFLVGKRASDKSYGGKWAFVGGKFESGESPEEALRREVREEIGMEVEIVRALPVTDVNFPDGNRFRLYSFLCKIGQGPLNLVAHDELRWVTPEELNGLDLLEGDKTILSYLKIKNGRDGETAT